MELGSPSRRKEEEKKGALYTVRVVIHARTARMQRAVAAWERWKTVSKTSLAQEQEPAAAVRR